MQYPHVQAEVITPLRGAPDVRLTVANALWGRKDVRLEASFLRSAHDNYDADVASLDLSTPEAITRINAWVDSATHGKISDVLSDPLPDNAALVLTNAVYFKGRWATRFDAATTRPRPFHLGRSRSPARYAPVQRGPRPRHQSAGRD
jgi:serine protease inhibitor